MSPDHLLEHGDGAKPQGRGARRHNFSVKNGDEFEKLIPMGRYARAEELGSAALFLASDESSYVSGAEIMVDGAYVGAGNMA